MLYSIQILTQLKNFNFSNVACNNVEISISVEKLFSFILVQKNLGFHHYSSKDVQNNTHSRNVWQWESLAWQIVRT